MTTKFAQNRLNATNRNFGQFWPVSTFSRNGNTSPSPAQDVTDPRYRFICMYKFKMMQMESVHPWPDPCPKERSGHRMVADDAGDLYSFGGFNLQVPTDSSELSVEPLNLRRECNTLFQELWKYNWRTRRWRKLKTMGDIPDKLVSHCMCYWQKKIIIYGGTGLPYGRKSSNKLTIYHIEQNRWEQVQPQSEPSKSPQEMYGQACVCDEERGILFVVGGTDGSKYNLDVHKFNLYTRKWTPLYKSTGYDPGEPGLRYRHEIALYNNKLFIFGGSTNEKFYDFKELPVFDLETNDWSYVKTKPHVLTKESPYYQNIHGRESFYPERRKCHSLGVIGNDCYMAGGTDSERVCSDLWHINLEELKWTLLIEQVPCPIPVYFHAATISLEGKLTIFGGVEDVQGRNRNNKLTQIWLKVPSLKNICLLAVEHYAKKKMIAAEKFKETGLSDAIEVAESASIVSFRTKYGSTSEMDD